MKTTRFWKKFLASMLALALVLTAVAVNDTQASAATKKKVTLSATKKTIITGKSFTLSVKKATGLKGKKAKFKSSNSKVAKVSSSKATTKVTVKGLKAGTATITATSAYNKKVKATCKVTVKQAVTKVKLNKKSVTLATGKTVTLKATVSPSKAANKKVTWKSSNTSIATVSSKGKVTAKNKTGKVTITATAKDGSKKYAKCTVTVVRKVTGVSVPKTATVTEGAFTTLKATVAPSNATNKTVTWKSLNTKVAIVSAKTGLVKGLKPGKVWIAATADGKTAYCCLTVTKKYVPVTKVAVNPKTVELDLAGTKTTKIAYAVAPANATYKFVAWSTSDDKVATVDKNGNVTAVGVGTATITARAVGGKTASCVVTVKDSTPVEPTEYTFNFNKNASSYEVKTTTDTMTVDAKELKDFIANTQDFAILLSANGSMVWSDDENKTLEDIWARVNESIIKSAPGVVAASVVDTVNEYNQRVKTVTVTKADGKTKTFELKAPKKFTGKDDCRYINIRQIGGNNIATTMYGMWIEANGTDIDVFFSFKNDATDALVSGGKLKLAIRNNAKEITVSDDQGKTTYASLVETDDAYVVYVTKAFADSCKTVLEMTDDIADVVVTCK